MILTSRQLALVRAALLFWSEEIGPHGLRGSRPYLDESIPDSEATREAITRLRQQLQNCQLGYLPVSRLPLDDIRDEASDHGDNIATLFL